MCIISFFYFVLQSYSPKKYFFFQTVDLFLQNLKILLLHATDIAHDLEAAFVFSHLLLCTTKLASSQLIFNGTPCHSHW